MNFHESMHQKKYIAPILIKQKNHLWNYFINGCPNFKTTWHSWNESH